MAKTSFLSVTDYVRAQPKPARAALERVRSAIKKALPRATEGISYQIPVYKVDGEMVLFFAGFARHYSLYPATARLLAALGKAAAGVHFHKATLRFPIDEPVPVALVARIAKLRAVEAAERVLAKAKKNSKKPASKRAVKRPPKRTRKAASPR